MSGAVKVSLVAIKTATANTLVFPYDLKLTTLYFSILSQMISDNSCYDFDDVIVASIFESMVNKRSFRWPWR